MEQVTGSIYHHLSTVRVGKHLDSTDVGQLNNPLMFPAKFEQFSSSIL